MRQVIYFLADAWPYWLSLIIIVTTWVCRAATKYRPIEYDERLDLPETKMHSL